MVRQGENDKHWYRSDRFFCVDGKWFFSTREGQDIGPFVSRGAAANGLSVYVRLMRDNRTSAIQAQKVATQGLWQTTLYH